MLVDDKDLKRSTEPWITAATVFLALELAEMTYSMTQIKNGDHNLIFSLYFGTGMIVCMVMALAALLGARDPRQNRFPTQTIIASAASMMAASLVFSAIMTSFQLYDITKDLTLSLVSVISLISAMVLFFPFLYFKYLHKKNINDDSQRQL